MQKDGRGSIAKEARVSPSVVGDLETRKRTSFHPLTTYRITGVLGIENEQQMGQSFKSADAFIEGKMKDIESLLVALRVSPSKNRSDFLIPIEDQKEMFIRYLCWFVGFLPRLVHRLKSCSKLIFNTS